MKKTNTVFKSSDALTGLTKAYALFEEYVGARFGEIGIKTSYRHVMHPLMKHDGVTQLELVRVTGLKAPTISITLRNMERENIVRREKNDTDRRETHVYITEKGREMYAKAEEAYKQAEKALLKGMTEKELESVVALTEKMSANLLATSGKKADK